MLNKILFTGLCAIDIFIAFYFEVPYYILVTLLFLIATAFSNCCVKDWSLPVTLGIIVTYSMGTGSMSYLWLILPIFLFSSFGSISEAYKEEQDYIWERNNGPSALKRIRFMKKDGIVYTYKWVGGANGYYVDNRNVKYDRYLNELKEDLS